MRKAFRCRASSSSSADFQLVSFIVQWVLCVTVTVWQSDPVDYLWKKHSLIQPGCWTEYQWQPDRREGGWRSFSYPCWLTRWLRWYCRVFPVHPRQSKKFISSYSVNQRKYWKKIIHSPSGLPPASKNTDSPRTDQMSDQSRRNWKKCLNNSVLRDWSWIMIFSFAAMQRKYIYNENIKYDTYVRLLSFCL